MDLSILIGLATTLLVIIASILWFSRRTKTIEENRTLRNVPARLDPNLPRRAQTVRGQRNRTRQTVSTDSGDAPSPSTIGNESESDDNETGSRPVPDFGDKMGTKKRAKLEAKAEKKHQREIENKLREEKKKREQLVEDERKKQEEIERLEEEKSNEQERLARVEKERRDEEEYLKMKAAFSIEEEGYEEGEDDDKENLLQNFIQYIKDNKVVVLEDLATQFKLKTQAIIDRIQELQLSGVITGVIDDRGKFIYISEDELNSVAKFINQRGRISISELAECSNNLINLSPPLSVQ